jgi:type IV pilus assembly protein PilA
VFGHVGDAPAEGTLMEHATTAPRRQDGFTLVELLVVVLVLGILVVIAVPTFLRAQDGAKTKAATSNLRSALSSAKTMHAEHATYFVTDAVTTVTKFREQEPALTWQTAPSAAPEQIAVASDGDTAGLATRSRDGHCYYVVDDVSMVAGGTTFGRSAAQAATCTPALDTTTSGITWADSPKLAGW